MNDTILLVDDDPATIQLLGRILAGQAQLRFATDGQSALRLARESTLDLILLDAEMPGMDGFEVCEALKADPDSPTYPLSLSQVTVSPRLKSRVLKLARPISSASQ